MICLSQISKEWMYPYCGDEPHLYQQWFQPKSFVFFLSSLWINAVSQWGFIPVCRREEVFVLITWDQRERLVIEHAKTVWIQYLNAHNMNLSRCCAHWHWESLLYASSSGDFGWRLSLGGHVIFEWLEFWTFTKFKGFLPMLFCHELLHHFFLEHS